MFSNYSKLQITDRYDVKKTVFLKKKRENFRWLSFLTDASVGFHPKVSFTRLAFHFTPIVYLKVMTNFNDVRYVIIVINLSTKVYHNYYG